MPKFAYCRPASLDEAVVMLAEYSDGALPIAGGTNLLIHMQSGAKKPERIIGLSGIKGLDYIALDGKKNLLIGAMARLSDIAESGTIQTIYSSLSLAASHTATVQIRNMGTLVGNICNASPCADTATPLLVYDAEVVIVNARGERTLPLAVFFRSPGVTALEKGELVREVRLPSVASGTGAWFEKLSTRSKVDIAAVSVSARVTLDKQGVAATVRIAMGSVAPVPVRALGAEKVLQGKTLSRDLIAAAGKAAAAESSPISDMRASASYRCSMVEVLTIRALEKALQQALNPTTGDM